MPPRSTAQPTLRENGLWSLNLRLLDRAVRVESPDEQFLEGLSACFQRDPSDDDGAREPSDLTVHVGPRPADANPRVLPERVVEATLPGFTLPWPVRVPLDLCSALTQWVALRTDRYYVFHAGAVARAGKALLLPAASGAGKSTTTAGLLRRGFQLLSDEIGAIEMETGAVAAYPRSLSLREDVLELLGLDADAGVGFPPFLGRFVAPEELGSTRAVRAEELVMIVLPHYRAGAPTQLERLKKGAALVALMQSSCSQPVHKVAGLDWVIALVERVPCYELHFSALEEALSTVIDAFERHAGEQR